MESVFEKTFYIGGANDRATMQVDFREDNTYLAYIMDDNGMHYKKVFKQKPAAIKYVVKEAHSKYMKMASRYAFE